MIVFNTIKIPFVLYWYDKINEDIYAWINIWQEFILGDIAYKQVLVKPAHIFDQFHNKKALLIVVVAR